MVKGRKASIPNYGRTMKAQRKAYAQVTGCSVCGKKPLYKFQTRRGQMKGACSVKHLRKVK